MMENLQMINLIIIPVMIYIIKIERRLTKIETLMNGHYPKKEDK